MKVIKLNRRWTAHRKYGFTHAMVFDDTEFVNSSKAEFFLYKTYGSSYDKGPKWSSKFRKNLSGWRNIIAVENESMITHMLLADVLDKKD